MKMGIPAARAGNDPRWGRYAGVFLCERETADHPLKLYQVNLNDNRPN